MSSYLLKDIYTSTDRYKIYVLTYKFDEIVECIALMQSQNISPVNIGKDLARYLGSLDDYSYLNIDAYDYIKKLLDKNKFKAFDTANDIIAIYNIGILLEPALELNAVQFLKEISKSAALIILWEHQLDPPDRLIWPTQKEKYFLDFSSAHLKQLPYAI
jgi:hypothetical protein